MMMMMITPCGGKLYMDVVGVPILCQCVIWSIYSLIGWRDQHVRRACPHPIYIYNSIYGQVSGEIRCSYMRYAMSVQFYIINLNKKKTQIKPT